MMSVLFPPMTKYWFYNRIKALLVALNCYIIGYQTARKWLKDRKERKLEFDDIAHYQKIIVALTETDQLMTAIYKIGIEYV
ncbi:hypothetical protein [Flavobacterium sp. RSP15]|uniref:hypothetical protein n=1 Tax=Flavobacterium sp. RSP15 TaxID=2497485 RepID=UPI000F831453|nr:hypothetical protein [Flavobacterium sp. RSP15]RTY88626.1 hypothetical protein EKM00_00255 [Flavobacterium sp. RSP15]